MFEDSVTVDVPSLAPERLRVACARILARRNEAKLRRLLAQWVSEMEPVVVYDFESRHILGLAVLDDPTGTIVVEENF